MPSGTLPVVACDPVVVVAEVAFVPQASQIALSRLDVPLARHGVPVTTGYHPASLRDGCGVCGEGEALVPGHIWVRASKHPVSGRRESSRDRRRTFGVKLRTRAPACAKRLGVRCVAPLWVGSLGSEGVRCDVILSRGSALDAATRHHSRNASGISRRLPILHATKAVLRTRTPKRCAQGGALESGVLNEDAGIVTRRLASADVGISYSTQFFDH